MMKKYARNAFVELVACLFLFLVLHGVAAAEDGALPALNPISVPAPVAEPASPVFLGSYGADGKYHRKSRCSHADDDSVALAHQQSRGVPKFVDRKPRERVIEDFEPPHRAAQPAQARSTVVNAFGAFLTLAYGREPVLHRPTHLTTDSKGRLIVADPEISSVHVLDPAGRGIFRIAGGRGRRLRQPHAVAVDGDDNILVADGERGMVLVYDSQGRFVRYIGDLRGESLFERPTALALDRDAGRLYVVDSTVHQVVVLDLQGQVLRRLGDRRRSDRSVDFRYPTEVAVRASNIVVVDDDHSRIQVLNEKFEVVSRFRIRPAGGRVATQPTVVAIDPNGHILVSNPQDSTVRVYARDGRMLGMVGRSGCLEDNFKSPSGIWVSDDGRIFIADRENSRVQVFQALRRPQRTGRDGQPEAKPSAGGGRR